MTDHVTPNKARELAGTLDLTQYAEHSDALMSLASQVEELTAQLREQACEHNPGCDHRNEIASRSEPEKAQPPVYLEDFAPGEILDGDFPVDTDGASEHAAGCTYGGFSCGYWMVAEGCKEDHFEEHVVLADGTCPCGHSYPGAANCKVVTKWGDNGES